jgi:hypothetical protein
MNYVISFISLSILLESFDNNHMYSHIVRAYSSRRSLLPPFPGDFVIISGPAQP